MHYNCIYIYVLFSWLFLPTYVFLTTTPTPQRRPNEPHRSVPWGDVRTHRSRSSTEKLYMDIGTVTYGTMIHIYIYIYGHQMKTQRLYSCCSEMAMAIRYMDISLFL